MEWSETVSEIQEPPSESLLNAYPNPSATGLLRIAANEQIGEYSIFDAAGKMIENGTCRHRDLRIALPTAGTYLFKSEAGTLRLVRR